MKALEKDRARRYGTPSELAADVGRYLHHEPVLAQTPSRAYRFRKYARRHRALLTAIAAVVGSLTVGVVATTFALVDARRARAEAIRQQALAEARLRSAQQYAEKLFFEIAPDITELPGATAVRTKLGAAGSNLVESLAVGANDDPQLRWQTARINLGLSQLQGWDYGGGSLRDYTASGSEWRASPGTTAFLTSGLPHAEGAQRRGVFRLTTTFKVLWTVWDALMKHFSTWIGWTSWPARLNLGATERRWRY